MNFILAPFKAIFSLTKTNPTTVIILAILVTIGIGGYKVNSHIADLKHTNEVLIAEKKGLESDKLTLVANNETLSSVNKANLRIIETMKSDQLENEKRLTELRKDLLKSNEKKDKLLEMIANSKPEDDGPIAPVLSRTIDTLQKGN